MITKEDVLKIHELSIKVFGGANGVRDEGLLDSAIARPYATFGGADLYQNTFEKAAAIGESLIINHPFIDGNKRTGFLAMLALLEDEGFTIFADNETVYQFVINISTGSLETEAIVTWLKENTQPI